MLLLAIDTSANASAALLRAEGTAIEVLGSFTSTESNDHSEVLAPAIESLLAAAGGVVPEAIAVGVGPGPFTGLRVGLATARTLGFVWGVPVHGVMSLDAIALDAVAQQPAGDFTVAIDARRKELYWARYDKSGALLDGPHVTVAEELPAGPVYGAGAGLYDERLAALGAKAVEGFENSHPGAVALGTRALRTLAAGEELLGTEPLYLRESDAKVPAVMKGKLL
ncbi:tRNA (adenosine(37)-N6)-threonylcarbamoyltransferase complex dimerization subunit type 1 TsaB [Paeniglutamicibacter psychrophenolicus]|uniref:tRNA threonylcarbamoyl adenosine modification protein YeaZ n=1 Tax=Paeniglutamicibacter psychrophenolicus TaxID=257454 RepID=A0ABS4WCV9_9MICC|nr:tRNA (adenosine(37)-N6)-threonylcarbamoyltransferase complex dimerization subunit type 1 TsaB [Paeniglutamicibacter psychrophenolicus]MBP2374041.1 tRNA threonylcarbamoyl adenosine modification protein YeaZ [Paeniglutamicibacter psychrophenolicus]